MQISGPAWGADSDRVSSGACGRCYHLPPHVYACRTESGVVFLDARRDRYFGLGGAQIGRVADHVIGLPGSSAVRNAHDEQSVTDEQVERVARKLIEAGLLRAGSGEDVQRDDKSIPPPDITQELHPYEDGPRVRAIDVVNFVLACANAAWSLRRLSLASIASRVSQARHETDGFDLESAILLAQRFQTLRAWTFTGKDRCLFSALSLIYFLQRYGCFPYFVIGVKSAPFAAHSWVQKDGVVLDGDPANVGHFVPILVA